MLVYGDRARILAPRDQIAAIERRLEQVAAQAPGVARHGALVGVFIEAGGLVQGLADAAFEAAGRDGAAPGPADELLQALAGAVRASWKSAFQRLALPDSALLQHLAAAPMPAAITVKEPEGYAFYTLYPEAYLEAASRLPQGRPWRVIGLRSIGTGLAALVAEALEAPAPLTLRPFGHPFGRRVALSGEAERSLLDDSGARFAVVDEGPGLSGSSFGAVLDLLEERGVPEDRVHVLPGHLGELGPQASERHRRRWKRVARHAVTFEDLVLASPEPAHRLGAWVGALLGVPVEAVEDVSGGAWRGRLPDEAAWPPALAHQERRKFLCRAGPDTWLARFAGLGAVGEAKLAMARTLARAGFTPEVAGLCHGFLVERWVEATPLDPGRDRAEILDFLGRYLGFRARHLTVPAGGASLGELLDMARHNAAEALGAEAAASLAPLGADLARLEARQRPVAIDGRLHRHEWLRLADGRLLKADALDHHAAHDLIGAQDIAWDVAGAGVEFGLAPEEREGLRRAVEQESGGAVDPALVHLLTPCYLAFQLGAHAMAAQALAGWPEEAARLRRAVEAYAEGLRTFLQRL